MPPPEAVAPRRLFYSPNLFLGVWFFIFGISLSVHAATCFPPPSGMAGWWPGDGNANDLANTNNGSLLGGATATGSGMVGSAFTFDGTNSYVQFPDSPAFHPTNLTVEAWIRFSGLDSAGSGASPAGDQYIIFKKNTRSSDFEGFDLGKERAGSSDYFRFLVSSASGQSVEVRSTTVISTSVWYHVAGVRGSNFTQLYVNGHLERQATVNFAQDYATLPLFFGTSGQASWDHKFKGLLDEPSLYNRALTSNEIAAIYAAGSAGKCGSPRILTQPQSQSAAVGSNVTLNVLASGTAPLGYQWQFNTTPIAAATASTLTLTNLQTTDAGNYAVLVTNSAGAITSATAVLSILSPPAITTNPTGATNVVGSAVSFSGSAIGSAPLSYRWLKNGSALTNSTRISGATSNLVTITNLQPSDAADYVLTASNTVGVATSSVATLAVLIPPSILVQPTNLTVIANSNALFTASATGSAPLSYQWFFNGAAVSSGTASSLLFPAQPSDAGTYAVVVTNQVGSVTSSPVTLTVLVPPTFASQPLSATNALGATASFLAGVTGTEPLTYQWFLNGARLTNGGRIAGATSNLLSIANLQTNDAGNYSLVVTNIAAAATSTVAQLTVALPPTIVTQPSSWSAVAGSNVSFSLTVSGTPAFFYQWQHDANDLIDGSSITGAATPVLNVATVSTNDAGNYACIVTNLAGSVTSAVATLTVSLAPIPPAITAQPATQILLAGNDVSFSITACGTMPLSYQWRKNGGNISDSGAITGAGSANLTISPAALADSGDYDVIVTNIGGSVTSSVATLTVNQPVLLNADAVVLVNSTSPRYSDFQRYIQPYLENFGMPYTVQNIVTNPVTAAITNHALIIIGHRALDTNHLYLSTAAQALISAAVSNGLGLVNFDTDLAAGPAPRYQFVQDIFGFAYSNSASATSVLFTNPQPALPMHYVTARHMNSEAISMRGSIGLTGLIPPTNTATLVLAGGKPLVTVAKFGQGRALQWASDDWMSVLILGPISGLDDVLWRGIVWTSRKPFVLRGMPNFAAMRIDDVGGPLWWAHIANEVGLKPFLAVFISDLAQANIPDLRSMLTNGNATACPHAFNNGNLIYFNHSTGSPYSDAGISGNFSAVTQWHLTNGLPFPKLIATHYSEIGTNAFTGLLPWGVEYVPLEVVPGTVEYATPGAPWIVAGPYRLYETPLPGKTNLPQYYADWLVVPGHPELAGKFFNCYPEMRGIDPCGAQWCPDNNVGPSADRGAQVLKRAFDSMVSAVLFTHDWEIQSTPSVGNTHPISTNNWRAILQTITNNIASYQPIYVTLEYENQYVRATKTSRISSSQYNFSSGQIFLTLTGKTDLDITVQVFAGEDNAITNVFGIVPAFTNSITATAATIPVAPFILLGPQSRTNNAGTAAGFPAYTGGTPPLSYRWVKNATNLLTDSANVSGASSASLMISGVLGADAGSYSLVVSNSAGSVTSAPPGLLTVIDPLITGQPRNRTNHAGTDARFTVTAVGTDLAFQWTKQDTGVLPLATDSSLTLPSVTAGSAGLYSAVISNAFGMATSAPAILSVTAPLTIQTMLVSNNAAAIQWNAIPGSNYTLQYKDDLTSFDWSNLSMFTASGPLIGITNIIEQPPQRFYRVLMQ